MSAADRNRGDMLSAAREAGAFLRFVVARFDGDRCLATAGALSYTSLLALVPLIAVFLSIFSAFPFFAQLRDQAEQELAGILMPTAEAAVIAKFGEFVDRAASMTGFGVIGLAVTSLLLLNTINSAFDNIWRVTVARPLVVRLLAYWAIISLGPLLFGAALWLSGVLLTTGETIAGSAFDVLLSWLAPLVPLLLEASGFALLYVAVPNRRVRRRDAICGGVTAAVLFEVLKRGFALYVIYFPAYQTIYGAISAIPIFLVWMYGCWAVALFGAEVVAALPEWRDRQDNPGGKQSEMPL